MRDPVNGYEVPEAWVERAAERGLDRSVVEERVESGWFFLTSRGSLLRRGFTTGTAAAAAAKAACLSLEKDVDSVEVGVPCGLRVEVEVRDAYRGEAAVVKDAGDHEDDATDGAVLLATAEPADDTSVAAGTGVGVATRSVGRLTAGEPAINPAPRRQIGAAVEGVGAFRVEVSVADGERLAAETRNDLLGVRGGISVLGTTGFVEPWCEELRLSLEERAEGAEGAVVTTGRMGAMYAGMLLPERPVFVFGKHVGKGLEAVDGDPVVTGLPGLILKWGTGEPPEGADVSSWSGAVERGERELLREAAERTVERARGIRGDAEVVILDWSGEVVFDSRGGTGWV